MISIFSCSTKRINEEAALATADSTSVWQNAVVATANASLLEFRAQVVSNGKVLSAQEIPMSFSGQGIIERVMIKNGMEVNSGQLLASLQNDPQKLALREADLQLNESRVEINDQLITQGGKRGDTASVSEEVFAYIKLRSGYNRALLAVEKAKLDLSKTYLYAPIAGTIANLALSNYSPTPTDKPFCTLLSSGEMLIRCPILETELALVKVGQIARVEPVGVPGHWYKAMVTSINPVVNQEGLVEVTIKVKSPNAGLLSGMNVRVVIERSLSRQLVVPRNAVVERSGRKVVFTYKDGFAKWHYVTTGQGNDREITIIEGLKEGEEVIVSGNLNLGHDAKVKKGGDGERSKD